MVERVFSASQLFIGLTVLTNFPFFIFSAYYIAFLKFNGLNYSEMAIVFAVSSLTIAILDFPTGNFADRYGRKKSIVTATLFMGVGMIVYGAANEVFTFAIGEFLLGVGSALMSGSLEAWYYDEVQLQEIQVHKKAQSTFGMGMGLMNITAIFAGFIASFLVSKDVSLPFFVSGGFLIFAALFAFVFLNENYGERSKAYSIFLKESLRIVSQSDQLRWLVAGIAAFNVSYLFYLFTYQPFLLSRGLDMVFLGGMFSLLMVVRAIFSFLVSFFRKIPFTKLNYTATLILGSGYLLMWASQNLISAVVGVILCEVCIGLWFPSSMVWRNMVIPSSHRATSLSFMSTLSSFVSGAFVLLIGPMLDSLSVQTYLVAVVCSVISALILYKASSLTPVQPEKEG